MEIVKKQTAEKIQEQELDIAKSALELCFKLKPEHETIQGKKDREESLQEVRKHLAYLSESVLASSQALFMDYVAWAQEMLVARNRPSSDLAVNLNCVKEILAQRLPIENYVVAAKFMNNALLKLEGQAVSRASYIQEDAPLGELASQYLEVLLKGDRAAASQLILKAMDDGCSIKDIYLHVFQPVQYEVGRLWQQDKLSVAQEHFCSSATEMIMSQLYSYIAGAGKKGYKLVAACVSGDQHEIGLRMVADLFELEGWNIYYLGANTPKKSILETLHEQQPDMLLLSATMAYHLHNIKEVIADMQQDAAIGHIKVMVGGYPFNAAPHLWEEVGANAYGENAADAVKKAEVLVTGNRGLGMSA